MYCAKTAEPIEMPFGDLTHVGPKNHVLDGVPGQTNPLAAAMVTRQRCGLLPVYMYFGHLYFWRQWLRVWLFSDTSVSYRSFEWLYSCEPQVTRQLGLPCYDRCQRWYHSRMTKLANQCLSSANTSTVLDITPFTARRRAGEGFATALWPCVCRSVCHKLQFYQND